MEEKYYGNDYENEYDFIQDFKEKKKTKHVFPEGFGKFGFKDDENSKILDSQNEENDAIKIAGMGKLSHGMLTRLMRIDHLSLAELDTPEDIFRYFGFTDDEIAEYGAVKIEIFLRNNRIYFLQRYKLFLNALLTPAIYAEFRGVDYLTVLGWIKNGKVDVIKIAGRKYVFPAYEEILPLDKWMMQEKFKKDSLFGSGMERRLETLEIYERRYAESGENSEKSEMEVLRTPVDDVKEWCVSMGITPFGIGCKGAKSSRSDGNARSDCRLDEKHLEYVAWAKANKKAELTRAAFSRRIRSLGFTMNSYKKRGFYYYAPFTEQIKEVYGRDEWTVADKNEI